MANKINIDPAALKRNLDLIIAGVVSLGLIGYGYMEYSATSGERENSTTNLESKTRDYNNVKEVAVPENFGFTNAPPISTERSHGNQALAE